ncbi:MAG: hypothetical protein AB1768_00825 [Pseudomonadota bacterium]|jgi:hypothetical protein
MSHSVLAIALLSLVPQLCFAAQAEQLGRLFLTPQARSTLERQRQLNIQHTQVLEGDTLSVTGVVVRSSGKSTTWINGVPQHDGGGATGVRVEVDRRNPGQATVIDGGNAPVPLKVGESLNRGARETTSSMGDGRIGISLPRPARVVRGN